MIFPSTALLSGIALYASAASAITWNVSVSNANASLLYSPNNITAAVGDIVLFTFNPKNHSVTQSSLDKPCTPLDGGFSSGFMPVSNTSALLPTVELVVNDTNPIWIHCEQAANTSESHCGKGMVFSINAGRDGSNNSFTVFRNNALAVGEALQNATNATTTASGSGSKPSSTGLGGSSNNGVISMNGVNAMLMTGLGMVVGLILA